MNKNLVFLIVLLLLFSSSLYSSRLSKHLKGHSQNKDRDCFSLKIINISFINLLWLHITARMHEERNKFFIFFMCEKHLNTLRLTIGTYLKYKGRYVGIFDWKTLPSPVNLRQDFKQLLWLVFMHFGIFNGLPIKTSSENFWNTQNQSGPNLD